MREQDPGGIARLRKLHGTKSSVGGGASGAHPAYTWKRGQIWGCAQRGVLQCAGPYTMYTPRTMPGQRKANNELLYMVNRFRLTEIVKDLSFDRQEYGILDGGAEGDWHQVNKRIQEEEADHLW